MNVERMMELAMALRASDTYEQDWWIHDCGSPACIAGHGAFLSLGKGETLGSIVWVEFGDVRVSPVYERAQDWLELPVEHADVLFVGAAFAWPEPYKTRYQTEEKKNHVAADLIEALARGEVSLEESPA